MQGLNTILKTAGGVVIGQNVDSPGAKLWGSWGGNTNGEPIVISAAFGRFRADVGSSRGFTGSGWASAFVSNRLVSFIAGAKGALLRVPEAKKCHDS